MTRVPAARLRALKEALPAGSEIAEARVEDATTIVRVTGSLGAGRPNFDATIVIDHVVLVRPGEDGGPARHSPEPDEAFVRRFSDALGRTVAAHDGGG